MDPKQNPGLGIYIGSIVGARANDSFRIHSIHRLDVGWMYSDDSFRIQFDTPVRCIPAPAFPGLADVKHDYRS